MQNQTQTGISSIANKPLANNKFTSLEIFNLANNNINVMAEIEKALENEFMTVQNLLKKGIITSEQGRCLILNLANTGNEIKKYKDSINLAQNNASIENSNNEISEENYLDLFNKENPDFFSGDGRTAVLNYIKDLKMDKDEINKIAEIVKGLESCAIDNYLKKTAHEKSLNDENLAARSKLTAYAQTANSGNTLDRIFTRDDIGKMSGDEFNKAEKIILEQVKKGLVK